MALSWYPRYPGDYARDTAQLTMLEHGAYTLLMDYYYSTGEPLPAFADANAPAFAGTSNPRLYRICRAVTQEEQRAVDAVIDDFFKLRGGKYHHGRIDEELEKRLDISEKRRLAREARMQKASEKEAAKESANAPANAPTNADTTTTTTTVLDIYIEGGLQSADSFFEIFWNAYPDVKPKGNKAKAKEKFKALFKLMTKGEIDHEAFIKSCGEYRTFCEQGGNYNQHAITWLNQRGWETDWASQTSTAVDKPQRGTGARQGAGGLDKVRDAGEKAKEMLRRQSAASDQSEG